MPTRRCLFEPDGRVPGTGRASVVPRTGFLVRGHLARRLVRVGQVAGNFFGDISGG